MQNNYNPTERTAKRAAKIWKDLLKKPKYDTGTKGFEKAFQDLLISRLPNNATDERLDAFEAELVQIILRPSEEDPGYFPNNGLHVDYGPCESLREAAEKAELKIEFPYKTNMNIHGDHLSVSAGYGAEWYMHYALENGKWLVTTLHGSEIEMIKQHIVAGTPLVFRVED